MFLISLFYTFSKIQETIWKSGKLEWRGQYFLFFPDVPDFLIHFSFKVLGFELGEGEIDPDSDFDIDAPSNIQGIR